MSKIINWNYLWKVYIISSCESLIDHLLIFISSYMGSLPNIDFNLIEMIPLHYQNDIVLINLFCIFPNRFIKKLLIEI